MTDVKDDGTLLNELLGLGRSLGKLTTRQVREWADEARDEVRDTVRELKKQVDQALEGDEPPPDA